MSTYVDDLLIAGMKMSHVHLVKKILRVEFDVTDLGEARMIIGMRIRRDRKKR